MSELALFQQAQLYLPKYLSPAKLADLWSAIKEFPNNKPFYTTHPALGDPLMQGDGWRGLVAMDFETGNKRPTAGVIVSNSCDINQDNQRTLPPNILFAPILRLDTYVGLLRDAGLGEHQIQSLLVDIRRQQVTYIFYLPAEGDRPESIIVLYDIHRHPLRLFLDTADRTPVFKLNQFGFYLFLIKVSIHFTRTFEGVARDGGTDPHTPEVM